MGDSWKSMSRIGRSSYGVLARKTDTPEKTMQWLEDSIASTFEGQVPPFCFPDKAMGPDLLFFLRDEVSWGKWKLCMWQHKFKTETNQVEALRTITPDLLFFANRGKATAYLNLAEEDANRWKELKKNLFKEKSLRIVRIVKTLFHL